MENGIQLDEITGIIRRRWRSFFIVFFSIILFFTIIALALSPTYLSKATILIESQQIPEDYVKSAITTYVEERLELITQQIMSRNQLIEIIDEFGLYKDEKAKSTSSEIVARMRDDIHLETISADVVDQRTGRESQATIAFSLSYEGKSPSTVQKVANKLASLYLEQNIKARTEQVSNTTTFLEQNLAEIQGQINEIEAKISAFKSEHYGELPESSSINLSTMQQLQRQLDQNNAQIQSLKERKIYLEGQLASIDPMVSERSADGSVIMSTEDRLRELRTELTSLKAIYRDTHPDIVRIENTIKELEADGAGSTDYTELVERLEELQSQRAILKETLTPQHPDIIRIDQEIQALSEQLKEADLEKIKKGIETETPNNPAYINIKTQIQTTEMDLETLIKEEKKIEAQIAVYQKRLESAPILEKEYNSLTRDYETAKNNYNEIMSKLMEARVAQGMEETQRGERFTIIDNALLPEKPYKPNRLAIILIGFVLAIGAGVGIAAFQESMDDSIKTSKELAGIIKVPILSVMPLIVSDEDKRRGKIRWAAMTGGALCIILLAIILVHVYVMPIEILMVKIQQRVMGG